MELKELTDSDILRWLLGKMRAHRGSQFSASGWWSLPADTLEAEAPNALEAIMLQIESEANQKPVRASKYKPLPKPTITTKRLP